MSLTEFCSHASAPGVDIAARTLLLADVLIAGPPNFEHSTPFAWQFGVCGVGVLLNERGILAPALFNTKISPNVFTPVDSELIDVITILLDSTPAWLGEVRFVGVDPPVPQISPGDSITCPNLSGSAGCNVAWSGKVGFLTAGHVAGSRLGLCSTVGSQVGSIVYSNDPSNHGASIEADIALVELHPGQTVQNVFKNPASAGPNEPIRVVTTQTGARNYLGTNVRGYSRWQYSPALNGTWGDVYLTTKVVTQPGNSGTPAIDSSNGVLGHVVGAIPNFSTMIQDISYQLSVISQQIVFARIKL